MLFDNNTTRRTAMKRLCERRVPARRAGPPTPAANQPARPSVEKGAGARESTQSTEAKAEPKRPCPRAGLRTEAVDGSRMAISSTVWLLKRQWSDTSTWQNRLL